MLIEPLYQQYHYASNIDKFTNYINCIKIDKTTVNQWR